MTGASATHWRELEVRTRLPISRALHPDDCPKLLIKGIEWA
ncbi:hypothetical protein LCGC14_1843260, partial [marine sediment metagenome]